MRRRAPLRVGFWALTVLAAIGSDLLADRWCHELPDQSRPGSAWRAADEGCEGDACAAVCVPDCFCCARSTVAAPLLMPPGVRPIDVLETPSGPDRRPGVLPLPDPPPLPRA